MKTALRSLVLFLLTFALLGLSITAHAAENTVRAIVIKGQERVEEDAVLSYLGVQVGEPYSSDKSGEMIKNLYNTGLFSNVSVNWDEGTLTVTVKENPLVNKVAFEGNDVVAVEKLKTLVHVAPRSVFTPEKAQQDVQDILAYYRQMGRFMAQVTPQTIQRDQNRVDVVYVIEEGDKTKVEDIRFIGNVRFSDSDLRTEINTREHRWWRFLSSSDVYDPDRIEADKELMRRFYLKNGYADFRIVSAVTELSPDRSGFVVTFTLSEGKPYNFGTLEVKVDQAEDPTLNKDELQKLITLKQGARYNAQLVDQTVDKMVDALGTKGYAFMDVKPAFQQNEAEQTISVVFNVTPGPHVYVNRIDIQGNDRTRENVIRREMRLAEGDAFSTNKLKRSKDRLTYLNFFEDVSIERKETADPDRMDLTVKVKEQSTGEVNVGAGFSSYEGLLATADVRERNFMGKGQDMKLAFSMSSRRQDYNFSFTEPWFLGQQLSAGVDLFNEKRDYQTESSYNTSRQGGAVRFGFPMDEYTNNTVRVGYAETAINNVDPSASVFVREQEGRRSALSLTDTLAQDTRDNPLLPTHGYRWALTSEYTGFGADINNVKGVASASWHHELAEDFVFSVGGRGGVIWDIDNTTPIFDNFNTSTDSLRGFEYGGIGPRDRVTNDALGGHYMAGHNVELSFPLSAELSDMGMHGVLFSDGGIVTGYSDDPRVIDSQTYRISAGTGVYWRSPIGPLRFDFGLPLVKAAEDKTRVFTFSFGTRF